MDNDSTERQPLEVTTDFYFAIIPEWVLALNVSSNAIRTYCVLRRFADNRTGECFPSRKTLGERCKLSVSTLDRAIAELVLHKAISVTPRKNAQGDWSSNLYVVKTLPDGGVSLPVIRPRATGDKTGVVAGGERTKAIRTKSNKNNVQFSEERAGASCGAGFAHAGLAREELIELNTSQSLAFQQGALEAYDRIIGIVPIPKQEVLPSWHSKYD